MVISMEIPWNFSKKCIKCVNKKYHKTCDTIEARHATLKNQFLRSLLIKKTFYLPKIKIKHKSTKMNTDAIRNNWYFFILTVWKEQ
jgi:hypothetical protein